MSTFDLSRLDALSVPALGLLSVTRRLRSFSPASGSLIVRPPNKAVAPALSFNVVVDRLPLPVGASLTSVTVTLISWAVRPPLPSLAVTWTWYTPSVLASSGISKSWPALRR